MFYTLWRHVRQYDWILMGAIMLMIGLGLVSLFSLSSASTASFFYRQIIWTVIGLGVMVSFSFLDFRLFRTQSVAIFIFYLLIVGVLAGLLVLHSRVRGVESWLRIGSVSIQPVEVAKLCLIILLAKFFSKRHIEIYRIEHLAVSGAYVAVPTVLVLAQPDLGSAIVLTAIWLSVILFSGMKVRHFFSLMLLGALLFFGAWHWGLHTYQKARITSFVNPYQDPKGAGYQMIQSMIAVGSGRIWGKGLGYGSQSHLNFLPEAEADFIFAAFAEEWGFVGTAALLALLGVIFWRIVRIGQQSADNFSRLYTLGFAAALFTQSFVHIGANTGIMPITGITLPFASYGGSSLITLLAGIGILHNIKISARRAVTIAEFQN